MEKWDFKLGKKEDFNFRKKNEILILEKMRFLFYFFPGRVWEQRKREKFPPGIWGHLELLREKKIGNFCCSRGWEWREKDEEGKVPGKSGMGGIPGGAGVGNGEVWRVFPPKN